jgi:hypothetical protein
MHWKQHWVVIAYALAAVHHLAPAGNVTNRLRQGWRRGQALQGGAPA